MKLMIDGVWRGDVEPTPELDAQRAIHAGLFRHRVVPAPAGVTAAAGTEHGPPFPAEAGRYHLFVSYACPFAHRTLLVRALKGLDGVIGLSVVHPVWNTPDGWVFGDTAFSTPDRSGAGFAHLHQAYAAARPDYTGKVTVPVLWDARTRRIVSNESADIMRMLNSAFDGVGGDRTVDLYPPALRPAIDALNAYIARDLAGGVYAVGGARTQAGYDAALSTLFACLDALEARLAGDGRAFLHGDRLTESDVIAFAPLVRFDAVYNPLFRASLRRLVDYPFLAAFVRRVYDLPRVAETVRFDHILMHYHDGDWGVAARRGIVPALPAVDFRAAAAALPPRAAAAAAAA
jgi:putative glutathione S-transferase